MTKPRKGEGKNEFISRCVSQLIKEEGREQKQALAICYSYWRRKDESIEESIDKFLIDEHFMSRPTGHQYPGAPSTATEMRCNECGKKFKKKLGRNTFEVKCPKCGSYDTEPVG